MVNILSAIFYFVKTVLSAFKLFRQVWEFRLEINQNLEATCVDSSTPTSMYVIPYSSAMIFYSCIPI